jgi:hypothetical protein
MSDKTKWAAMRHRLIGLVIKPESTETPECFGTVEVWHPQSRAENSCDDCPWGERCSKETNPTP